ncbi:MAG TPA: phenylalanine--tRNA ligase beta subunit-related protein, partial [Thermoanaerobaculia bacterium]|nr:phenylalanine--tRNA ligase beta subunit-related protein [Thermoanaerobaculia bacterium]
MEVTGANSDLFRISPAVFERIPGLEVVAVVAVVATGIRRERNEEVDAAWTAAWAEIHERFPYPNAQGHPHVAAWRVAMRAAGAPHKEFPTSIESLVRRALKSAEPLRIDPLVDFYNTLSLRHVAPAGGYDLDALDGPLELLVTHSGEP